MKIASIIAGAGDQDVEVYATDSAGRFVLPSAATIKIVDLSEPESADDAVRVVLASVAADIDATATTTSAAAGSNESDTRLLTLTSAVGVVVGRRYLVAAAGASESVIIERINGAAVYCRDPLRGRFASGATFVGIRISATFPSSRADDAAELARRVEFGCDWTFTGVTGPSPVRTMCRIERRGRAPRASVDDLLQLDPQLGAATNARTTLEAHLRQADRELSALLMRGGRSLPEHEEGDIAGLAVLYRAIELAYRVLADHGDRATWAGGEAKRWIKMAVDGYQADDAVEVTRTNDQARPRRRSLAMAVVTP